MVGSVLYFFDLVKSLEIGLPAVQLNVLVGQVTAIVIQQSEGQLVP